MSNKRVEAMKILVVIMIMFSWRTCEAEYSRRHTSPSRPQRFFKVRRPQPLQHHHNHNHGFIGDDYYPPESFSGFLPKTMPIPPSAPSKKHNVYGLQSTNSQRYP
ncbi:Protein IDA-LIKE 5 [Hirschfeldia incana]|nr:Protein IDA-LIKE 5 [Hirschfeldia incana]